MDVKSKEFENGDKIPAKFTADGKNVNPELEISNIPKNAKSLVLIVEDPDAKRVVGYTWVHWVVFDIDVNFENVKIKENSVPGIPGESTYKKPKYGGPNPPAGTGVHNYHFKIFALDKKLELLRMTKLEKINSEMKSHILDKAEIVGQYSRD